MNIITRKDTVLVSMNTVELADVGARNGMIFRISMDVLSDELGASRFGKPNYLSRRAPFSYYTHVDGEVHILRVIVGFWQYFKDVQPSSPWEEHIRGELVALGLSGTADELTAKYSA